MKSMGKEEKRKPSDKKPSGRAVKFQVYGEAMLDKKVGFNGNVGRIYLPGDWVGHRVKIIRIE